MGRKVFPAVLRAE